MTFPLKQAVDSAVEEETRYLAAVEIHCYAVAFSVVPNESCYAVETRSPVLQVELVQVPVDRILHRTLVQIEAVVVRCIWSRWVWPEFVPVVGDLESVAQEVYFLIVY